MDCVSADEKKDIDELHGWDDEDGEESDVDELDNSGVSDNENGEGCVGGMSC
jgi:hypothetical protein